MPSTETLDIIKKVDDKINRIRQKILENMRPMMMCKETYREIDILIEQICSLVELKMQIKEQDERI